MKTFISYSHQDESWFHQLRTHISPLIRRGDISLWSDHEILAGQLLNNQINQRMAAAELFLLLLSPAYLASDYCMDVELPHALGRYWSNDVNIVPIIVEACKWQAIPKLKDLKIIPKDAKPIRNWEDHNTAFVEVIEEIYRVVSAEENKQSNKFEVELTSPVLTTTASDSIELSLLKDLDVRELVEQLKQGKRKFSGIRVKELELINYDFEKVDFSGSDLSGARLEGANLSKANLSDSNLSNANLYGSILSSANLMNTSLENAILTGTNLEFVNLFYSNLKNAYIDMAELGGANLIRTNLEGADLFASKLVCANLWGAVLVNSNLERGNFSNSNLVYSKLSGANLSNSVLKFANLMQADLQNTNLENADLSYSILTQAKLGGSSTLNANFAGSIS